MKRTPIIFILILFLAGCQVFFGTFSWSGTADVKKAEELSSQERYDEAIALYQKHLERRLSDKRRADDENPYFYKILIGDTYLKAKKPKEAEAAFQEARAHEVETPLVTDRFRKLGKFYSDRGRFQEALAVYKKYRELDPFVFDIDIDETHKAMVEEEDRSSE